MVSRTILCLAVLVTACVSSSSAFQTTIRVPTQLIEKQQRQQHQKQQFERFTKLLMSDDDSGVSDFVGAKNRIPMSQVCCSQFLFIHSFTHTPEHLIFFFTVDGI